MRKALKIFGILILMITIFRGTLFRLTIKYNEIGTRQEIVIKDENLLSKINETAKKKKLGFEEIVEIATEITNSELKFTSKNVSNNPNDLLKENLANCVGYSAMFNSITNYLIKKYNLQNEIEAKHRIGQLEFLGIDIHQFWKSSFFKDHDFNEVRNIKTDDVIFIDPTVSDYLWIKRVSKKTNLK